MIVEDFMNRGVLLLKRSHQALHHYKVKMVLPLVTVMKILMVIGDSDDDGDDDAWYVNDEDVSGYDDAVRDGEDDEGHLNAWYVSECSSHEGALDRLLHYVSSPGVSSSLWS